MFLSDGTKSLSNIWKHFHVYWMRGLQRFQINWSGCFQKLSKKIVTDWKYFLWYSIPLEIYICLTYSVDIDVAIKNEIYNTLMKSSLYQQCLQTSISIVKDLSEVLDQSNLVRKIFKDTGIIQKFRDDIVISYIYVMHKCWKKSSKSVKVKKM